MLNKKLQLLQIIVTLFEQFPTLGSVCKKDLYWLDLVSHFGHFCDTRKFAAKTRWPKKEVKKKKSQKDISIVEGEVVFYFY